MEQFDYLKSIGFYTLEDNRARLVNRNARLWRCELLLTSRCNFKCPYCRGLKEGRRWESSWEDAAKTVRLWASDGLKNIRFSGGEPTLWKGLGDLVSLSVAHGVEKVAISTNGSAHLDYYKRLIDSGVNDFSISLDSCCASTGEKMVGRAGAWDLVVSNISELSKFTYVTIGVVITDDNINEVNGIISLAEDIGVDDVRIIPAAQTSKILKSLYYGSIMFPILTYRLKNFTSGRSVRGISISDNHQCPLVLDDMAVVNNKHYPCIIYLREGGDHIGTVGDNMRTERAGWYLDHDSYKDDICRNNCLDVCVDYNNRVRDINKTLRNKETGGIECQT